MSDQRRDREGITWVVRLAIAVVLASALLLGASALPNVCPAIAPIPASCLPGARVPAALTTIAILVVGWVGLVIAVRVVSVGRRPPVLAAISVALGVVLVLGLGWTVASAGFMIP